MKITAKRTGPLLHSTLYVIAIVLPLVAGSSRVSALTGSGTGGDPYVITSCTDLQNITTNPASYYVLGSDIDCTDTVNWNGGAGFSPIGSFSGTLDGQDHTISGLYENIPSSSGLFSAILNGTVENLNIDGAGSSITGDNGSGVLSAVMYGGTISHVHVHEDMLSTSGWSGGLVGVVRCITSSGSATIDHSEYSGNMLTNAGSLGYGGLVGYVQGDDATCPITFSNDSSNGTVTFQGGGAAGQDVGGLIGEIYTTAATVTVIDSGSSSAVAATSQGGGLVGFAFRDGGGDIIIRSSYANGSVSGIPAGHNTGGLVGEMYGQSQIYDSYATGSVNAGSNVGGLVGIVATDDIGLHDVYAAGDVTGDDSVGGLVGVLGSSGGAGTTLANSYATGNVSGNANVGGLVGALYGAAGYSFAAGAVAGTDSSSTGGLFGYYNPSFFSSSTGNAFDSNATGQLNCYGGGCNSSMTPVTTAGYFTGNNSDTPLNQWDFNNIWQVASSGYPTFIPSLLGSASLASMPSANQITLSWILPSGDQIPSAQTLEYSSDNTNWTIVSLASNVVRTTTIVGLQPTTSYWIRLRFTNSFGTSDWLSAHAYTAAAPENSATNSSSSVTSSKKIGANNTTYFGITSVDTATGNDISMQSPVDTSSDTVNSDVKKTTKNGSASDINDHSAEYKWFHSSWTYGFAVLSFGALAYAIAHAVRRRV